MPRRPITVSSLRVMGPQLTGCGPEGRGGASEGASSESSGARLSGSTWNAVAGRSEPRARVPKASGPERQLTAARGAASGMIQRARSVRSVPRGTLHSRSSPVAGHRQLTARGALETIPRPRTSGACGESAGFAAGPEADHTGDPGHARATHFGSALSCRHGWAVRRDCVRPKPNGHGRAGDRPGAATADRSGASAQGNPAGTAHADDASANRASGSPVNVALTKPADSTAQQAR